MPLSKRLTFSQNKIITSEVIIFRLCYSVKIPDIGTLMEKYPEASVKTFNNINAQNSDTSQKIENTNPVEKTVAYTEDEILKLIENDTIIYGYFKSSCEIQKIEKNNVYIGEAEKLPDNIKLKIEKILNPMKIHWTEKNIFDQNLISNMKGIFTISKEEDV